MEENKVTHQTVYAPISGVEVGNESGHAMAIVVLDHKTKEVRSADLTLWMYGRLKSIRDTEKASNTPLMNMPDELLELLNTMDVAMLYKGMKEKIKSSGHYTTDAACTIKVEV